ncbi:autotransporter-associated beta strand repeat-containing protein [Novosphingobium sp. 1949]|uniref:Autotransporter-associated beta strand repeat-containing protein n=1 Tax=Novosphingobium organovorum TaxID=2930092 RepID=A0ABT0BHD7_9SPHN|nr:autotransporter-associated beta strand repeat-containing protein [Novosphingobium organovorum]MCJ2184482.1 autotransporter-associated beta strand repeat-containing protein [Novosphingobium organovorum]
MRNLNLVSSSALAASLVLCANPAQAEGGMSDDLSVSSGTIIYVNPKIVGDVDVSNGGAVFAWSEFQSGDIHNDGLIALGGEAHTGSIFNSGVLVNSASVFADGTAINDGTWAMAGDIYTSGAFKNDGSLVVVSGGDDGTEATERTIETTGFWGNADGSVDLGNNTLVIDQSGNSTYAGTFEGSGSLVKDGEGTLRLTGASTFTGGLTIAEGTIDTHGGGTLADTLAVSVETAGAYVVGTDDTIGSLDNAGRTFVEAALTTGSLDNSGLVAVSDSLAVTGDATNSGLLDIHRDASTSVGGDLDNSGTIVNQGDLTVDGTLTNEAGATIVLGSSQNAARGHGHDRDSASTTLGALDNSGTVVANSSLTVSGAVTNTETGSITLGQGSDPTFGSLTNAGEITANAYLVVEGSYTQNAGVLYASQGLSSGTLSGEGGTIVLGQGSTYTLDQSADGTYSGAIITASAQGNRGHQNSATTLEKSGTGTLTLAGGENSIQVDTLAIEEGGVTVANDGALGVRTTVTTAAEGTFTIEGDQTITALYNAGTANIDADLTTQRDVVNQGTVNLAGDLTSRATVNTGTLNVMGDSSSGTEEAATRTLTTEVLVGSGTIDLGGGADSASSTANTLVIDLGRDSTYAGAITGAGSLVKEGDSTLRLTGASTFTGGLTIAEGTIDTHGGGTLADTLAVSVEDAGAYIVGTDDTIGSLDNAGRTFVEAALTTGSLTNAGLVAVSDSLAVTGDASSSGLLDIHRAASVSVGGALDNTGLLTNEGTLTVTGNASNAGLLVTDRGAETTIGGDLDNTGLIANLGTLDVAGTVTNQDGATILLIGAQDPWDASAETRFGALDNAGTLITDSHLTVTGAVTNAETGSITLEQGADAWFGSLTNAGTITANSVLVVDGAYTQNAGTLYANADLYTGTLSGTGGTIALADGVTYTLDQSADGTYSGAVSGANALVVKTGTGTLTLDGAQNSFASSALLISEGEVLAASENVLSDDLTVYVASEGTLALGADQTIYQLYGDGTLSLDSYVLTVTDGGEFTGTITGTGYIDTLSGTLELTSTYSSTSTSFTIESGATVNLADGGSITADSFTVNGGTLNLDGTVSGTTVTVTNGGTLHLGNGEDLDSQDYDAGEIDATSTVVEGGGSLTGNGYVSGTTTINDGTLAPGNSPGVMTFDDLVLADGSTTQMQIEGTSGAGVSGGYDQIVVNNSLTIASGASLEIDNSANLGLGETAQLFSYDQGAVSGYFGSASASEGNLMLNLSTGEAVGLGDTSYDDFVSAVSVNANASAILGAEVVNTEGGVAQYYGGHLLTDVTAALANDTSVADVFARWSPEAYTGILDQMKTALLANLPDLGGYDELTAGRHYLFGSYNRSGIDGQDKAGYVSNRLRDDSFNLGMVYQLAHAQVTMAYGHSAGSVSSTNFAADVDGDELSVGVSAPFAAKGALRASGRVAYGKFSSDGTRTMNHGTATFNNVSSDVWSAMGGLEYLQHFKRWKLTVNADMAYLDARMDGFTESGSGDTYDLMHVHTTRQDYWVGTLTGRLDYALDATSSVYGKVKYTHEFGDEFTQLTANIASESLDFTVSNPGLSQDRVMGGVGIQGAVAKRFTVNAEALKGTDKSFAIRAGLSVAF